jgi:hypothetical protein
MKIISQDTVVYLFNEAGLEESKSQVIALFNSIMCTSNKAAYFGQCMK